VQKVLDGLEQDGFVERVEGRVLKRDVPTASVKHTLKRREQVKDTRMKHTYYEPTESGEEGPSPRLRWRDAERVAEALEEELERRRHEVCGDLVFTHYSEVEVALIDGADCVTLEGVEVELDPELSVDENAYRHYEAAEE